MGELLLMKLGGERYAIRRGEILSLTEARSVQRLPFASSSIAALCSVGERTLTLADLPACLGLPASGQGVQALVLSESERVAGFLAGGELTVLPSSTADVRPLPPSISTAVVDTCVFLGSQPVPLINLRTLYRLALSGEPAPAIAWRAPSGPRAATAGRPRLRRVLVAGTLFAVSGPEGFGGATDARGLSPLPRAPAHLAGVAVLGGAPVPVVDLARRAGLAAPGQASAIVETRLGSSSFGLLVDEDLGDWNAEGIRVRPLPPLLATPWMRSAALLAGEMVPVLELEEILSAGAGGEGGRAEPRYRPGSAFPDLFGREDSDVVEFSLLGATHALPKCEVAETLAWKPSHRVPLAPPIAAGALEQGDAILPVIDLAAAFGMVSSPSPRWRMLLVGNGDFHALVLSEAVLEERRLEKEAQQDLPIELPFPVVYGCYTHGNSVRLILNVEELAVHFDPSLARHLHPAFSFGLGAAPAAAEEERAEAPARPPEAAASGSSAGQAATQVEEQAPAEIEPAEIAPAEATEAAPPFAAPPEEAAEQPAGAGDVVPAEVAFEAAASEEGSRPEEAAGAHPLPAAAEARPLAEAAAGYPDEVAVEISFDAGPPRPEAKAPSLTASVETLPGASLAEALPSAKLPEASAYQGQPAGGLPSAEPPLEEPGWITVSLSGGADEELDLPPREEAVVEPLAREPLEAAAGLPAIEEPLEAVVGLPAIEEPEELVIGAPVVEELRVPGLLPAQAAEEALPVALPGAVSQAEPVPALSRPRERVQGAAGGKSGRNKIAVAAGAVLFAGVVFAVLFAVGIIPWHAATKGSAPAPAAPAPAAAAPAVATPPATTAGKPELELSLPAGSTIEASEYIVQKGDTLWSIARRFTGNPFNYPRIAGENRIADPDLIFPGQRIRLTREKAPPAGGDR